MDFPIVVASPKDEGKYAFKAIQTYDNDDKVKWTGKENSEHPAPTLEVKKNANAADVKDEKSKILLVNKHLQVAQLLCG